MQRSATRTGPGMSRCPRSYRPTVRTSMASAVATSICDKPSAVRVAWNSAGSISGGFTSVDPVDRDRLGAGTLGRDLRSLRDVGLAVGGQGCRHVEDAHALRPDRAELEAALGLPRGGAVGEAGVRDRVHEWSM